MDDVERFLASQQRYRCERLSADLTVAQCEANRQRTGHTEIFACKDCAGLGKAVEISERRGEEMSKKLTICKSCGKECKSPGRGLCPKCYYHDKKENPPQPPAPKPICSVAGCQTLAAVNGKCRKYYDKDKWAARKGATIPPTAPSPVPPVPTGNPLLASPPGRVIVLNFDANQPLYDWLQEREVTPEHIMELLNECYQERIVRRAA